MPPIAAARRHHHLAAGCRAPPNSSVMSVACMPNREQGARPGTQLATHDEVLGNPPPNAGQADVGPKPPTRCRGPRGLRDVRHGQRRHDRPRPKAGLGAHPAYCLSASRCQVPQRPSDAHAMDRVRPQLQHTHTHPTSGWPHRCRGPHPTLKLKAPERSAPHAHTHPPAAPQAPVTAAWPQEHQPFARNERTRPRLGPTRRDQDRAKPVTFRALEGARWQSRRLAVLG